RALRAKNPKAIKAVNAAQLKKDIPPGSNVYKTKSGRIVIERPEDIGKPTGTAMRDNVLFERKADGTLGEKLFPVSAEKTVSAILDAPKSPEFLKKQKTLTLDATNKELLKWSKEAKILRKKEVEPAIKALRKRQAARGESVFRQLKRQGASSQEAIRASVKGLKIKAEIPDVTPHHYLIDSGRVTQLKLIDYIRENLCFSKNLIHKKRWINYEEVRFQLTGSLNY
ncbi:hypothetical protein LCGC14_2781750, partial [marine sediment metagenome]